MGDEKDIKELKTKFEEMQKSATIDKRTNAPYTRKD